MVAGIGEITRAAYSIYIPVRYTSIKNNHHKCTLVYRAHHPETRNAGQVQQVRPFGRKETPGFFFTTSPRLPDALFPRHTRPGTTRHHQAHKGTSSPSKPEVCILYVCEQCKIYKWKRSHRIGENLHKRGQNIFPTHSSRACIT